MPTRQKPLFLARGPYRQRRIRDAARLLPILGVILWLIPLLWTRGGPDGTKTSTALIYVFSVWAIVIVLSFLLSRWLGPDQDEADIEDAD
jgi:hypothetical protein